MKAARHRHWILFMVTLGSTLCQVLTVSMSALFERRSHNVSRESALNRTVQVREFPVITTTTKSELEQANVYEQAMIPMYAGKYHPDLLDCSVGKSAKAEFHADLLSNQMTEVIGCMVLRLSFLCLAPSLRGHETNGASYLSTFRRHPIPCQISLRMVKME